MAVFPGYFLTGPRAFGLLLVRCVIGVAFITQGLGKVTGEGGPLGWMPSEAGIPAFVQAGAAFSELIGGGLLILGFLTPLAALAIAGVMCGALATVHLPLSHAFVASKPGDPSWELAAIYLATAIMLFIVGPGTLSLDARLFGRSRSTLAAR